MHCADLQRAADDAAEGDVAGAPHRPGQLPRADNAREIRHRLLHIPAAQHSSGIQGLATHQTVPSVYQLAHWLAGMQVRR
jgi:hypothetical protein